MLRFRDAPRAVAASALALGAAVLLPVLAPYTATPDGEITVAAVQGNVPGPGTDILYDHRQVTRNHVDTTIRLAADAEAGEVPAPDLVLWPENATALDPFRDASLNQQIREAVAAVNVPILVGAIVDDPRPGKILNQGIVWNPVTGAADRYTKRHPVPYGEYIPWRDSNPLTSRFDELARVARDMQAGTRVDPLMISGVPVADAICFDVAYDEGIYAQLRAGARLLVVQTSNATFSRTSQLDQQFDITRVRAIETGRHVAVASTNGITGIIAPDGTPTSVLDRWTQGYVVEQVPLTSDVPPGIRLGPAARPGLPGRRHLRPRRGAAPVSSDERPRARRTGHGGQRRRPTPDRRGPPVTDPDRTLGRVVMVMPTYNEAANLEWIVGRLREVQPEVDVLVVDDGSPDGTGAIADRLAAADAQVKVVHRAEKQGLGAAYRHGFRVALDEGYDVIGEMDADGSHQPEELHTAADRAARRRPGDRVALGPRRLGGQLAAPARGSLAWWQPLRAAPARHPRARRHGRLSALPPDHPGEDRPAERALHRLRLPDRHGLPHPAGRPPGHRGADRVRRAGARRLQDVRGGGPRVPPADHGVGAARAASPRCGGWAGGCGADERGSRSPLRAGRGGGDASAAGCSSSRSSSSPWSRSTS